LCDGETFLRGAAIPGRGARSIPLRRVVLGVAGPPQFRNVRISGRDYGIQIASAPNRFAEAISRISVALIRSFL